MSKDVLSRLFMSATFVQYILNKNQVAKHENTQICMRERIYVYV